MKDLIVIIPAYNPPKRFIPYVEELEKLGFLKIIIVNDGSHMDSEPMFTKLKNKDDVILLHHSVNRGQGFSLKKAYSFILKQKFPCIGVITVDADWQHAIDDVIKVSQLFLESPTTPVLGVRDFNAKQVPMTRKFANGLTNAIFSFLYSKKIHDTQSGLRVFPIKLFPELCKIKGERFEYALMVLIELVTKKIEIRECTIQTIYYKEKKASTFRPVRDSMRILKIMWKGKR